MLQLGLQAQEHTPIVFLNNDYAGSLCGQTQKAVLKLPCKMLYTACLTIAPRSEAIWAA